MTNTSLPGQITFQPPEEITRGLFGLSRRVVREHRVATDSLLFLVLLGFCTMWLAASRFASPRAAVLQMVLLAVVIGRRAFPSSTFVLASVIAFGQWMTRIPLAGDVALLIALYTVAAHQARIRALVAAGMLEAGAVLAAVRWEPAGTLPRSLLFLSAMVVAALFAGLTAASGSRYLDWMDERARRLELERDQQSAIAAAAERTRIARELHDIVSHSLSVVITLADAAAVIGRADPGRGADAMAEVSEVGRQALSDMRAMLGVLRTDQAPDALAPQPGVAQLAALAERVRAAGLGVTLSVEGNPFPMGAAAELTVYRIVQEALTNALRHAAATESEVLIRYDRPRVELRVSDDGTGGADGVADAGRVAGAGGAAGGPRGHGIDGMRERAALHGGELTAGPAPEGGWLVTASLRGEDVTGT